MIVAASAPAHALLYNASYMLIGGDVVEMTFDGTLQGDLDTIVVNFLAGTPTFNGVAPALGAVSGFLSVTDFFFSGLIYLVHLKTRKSPGLMTRKLSVTELRNSGQFRGTCSRRNPSVALANWVQVA